MTTDLKFTAPADLSVGRVSISDAGGNVSEWIATPDHRAWEAPVRPGFYTAQISPAGVAPQSVIFEVHADRLNEVTAPSFSSLVASNGNMTFLDTSSIARAMGALYGSSESAASTATVAVAAPGLLGIDMQGDEPASVPPTSSSGAMPARQLRIGLSAEAPGQTGTLRPFVGDAAIELSEVRLELVVSGRGDWSPYSGERVHLTLAVAGLRLEQVLLPMYRGGTRITVAPSFTSSSDVDLEILPNDARLRALARVLGAGTPDEAKAVQPLLRSAADFLSADQVIDPWEAILSALLSIRFPDSLPGLNAGLADGLVLIAPWAHDSHVIAAHQHLYAVEDEAGNDGAATAALQMLGAALDCGQPYFNYTNQLFAGMIQVIHRFFDEHGPRDRYDMAGSVLARWQAYQATEPKAGVCFSSRGPASAAGILPPGPATAAGDPFAATMLFEGQIVSGRIRLDPAAAQPAKASSTAAPEPPIMFNEAPADCPALGRKAGPENDPNLGRFGGRDSAGGYTLRTSFDGDPEAEIVTIAMIVASDRDTDVPPDAVAWFCLHPTFQPQWIKVLFGNGRAVCSVQSMGGFTVGIWLPHADIELESDLSKLPRAPRIVRER